MRSLDTWHFARNQNISTSVWAYVFFKREREGGIQRPPAPPPPPPPPPFGAKLREIDLTGVPLDLRDKVRAAIGVRAGEVLSEKDWHRAGASLRKLHPQLRLMLRSGSGGVPKLVVYLEQAAGPGSPRGK